MKIDRSKIKLVDGFKIRSTIDIDFTTLHYSSNVATYFSPKFYIPDGEGWLDYRYKDEMDFLIKLEEVEVPKRFKTYAEQRTFFKEQFCKHGPVPEFKMSEQINRELKIVVVNGKVIRNYMDPEFVAGGHEFVYSYVPSKEIWLDNVMDPRELLYVELHEKVEWEYMRSGKTYDVAHEYANTIEKEKRREDGVAVYVGDHMNPWFGKTNEELAKEFYV